MTPLPLPPPMLAALFLGDPADAAGGVELPGTRRTIRLEAAPGGGVTLAEEVALRWTDATPPPTHAAVLTPDGAALFAWPIPHPRPEAPRRRGGVTLPRGFPMPVAAPASPGAY